MDSSNFETLNTITLIARELVIQLNIFLRYGSSFMLGSIYILQLLPIFLVNNEIKTNILPADVHNNERKLRNVTKVCHHTSYYSHFLETTVVTNALLVAYSLPKNNNT